MDGAASAARVDGLGGPVSALFGGAVRAAAHLAAGDRRGALRRRRVSPESLHRDDARTAGARACAADLLSAAIRIDHRHAAGAVAGPISTSKADSAADRRRSLLLL